MILNTFNLHGRKTNFRGRRDGPGCHLCRRQMVKRSRGIVMLSPSTVVLSGGSLTSLPTWKIIFSFVSGEKRPSLGLRGWENATILVKKLFYIFLLVILVILYLACGCTASSHQVQAGELEENPKPHHFDHKCVSLKEYKSPFLKV